MLPPFPFPPYDPDRPPPTRAERRRRDDAAAEAADRQPQMPWETPRPAPGRILARIVGLRYPNGRPALYSWRYAIADADGAFRCDAGPQGGFQGEGLFTDEQPQTPTPPAWEISGNPRVPLDGTAIVELWPSAGGQYYSFFWPEPAVPAAILSHDSDGPAYGWGELAPAPGGLVPMAGGRFGTGAVNPAIEVNGRADVPLNSVQYLHRGHGRPPDVIVNVLVHGDNDAINPVHRVYLANVTGGTFTLTVQRVNDQGVPNWLTTPPLPYTVTAGELEDALQALPNLTNTTVTGSGTLADPWLITYLDTFVDWLPTIGDPFALQGVQEWHFNAGTAAAGTGGGGGPPGPNCQTLSRYYCIDGCLVRMVSLDCGQVWYQDTAFPGAPCPCPEPGSGSGSSGSVSGCPQDCWMAIVDKQTNTYFVLLAYQDGLAVNVETIEKLCGNPRYDCSPLYASPHEAHVNARLFLGIDTGTPAYSWGAPKHPCGPDCIGSSGSSGSASGSGTPCCNSWVVGAGQGHFEAVQNCSNGRAVNGAVIAQLCTSYTCAPWSYPSHAEAEAAGRWWLAHGDWPVPGIPCTSCGPPPGGACTECPQNCWVAAVAPGGLSWQTIQAVFNGQPVNQQTIDTLLAAGYDVSPLYPANAEAVGAAVHFLASGDWDTPSTPCGPDCDPQGSGPPAGSGVIDGCCGGVDNVLTCTTNHAAPFSMVWNGSSYWVADNITLDCGDTLDFRLSCGPGGASSGDYTLEYSCNAGTTWVPMGLSLMSSTCGPPLHLEFSGVMSTFQGCPGCTGQGLAATIDGGGGAVPTGGPAYVKCCPGPLPATLYATLAGEDDCACGDGTYPIAFSRGLKAWQASLTLCGKAVTLSLLCLDEFAGGPNNWQMALTCEGVTVTALGTLDCDTHGGTFVFPGPVAGLCDGGLAVVISD